MFYKRNSKKKKGNTVEKVIKRKGDKYMLNGKATIVFFNSWIDKKYFAI